MVEDLPDDLKLPSGSASDSGESDATNSKFDEFLPKAEYYEAESQNLELLIQREKRRISKELLDSLLKLQYELSQKEYELKVKEQELNLREQDLIIREQQLARQIAFEELKSPKEREEYEDILEEGFDNSEFEGDTPSMGLIKNAGQVQLGQKLNPQGRGLKDSIEINRGEFQGPRIQLENGNSLVWNTRTSEYEDEFVPGPDERTNRNRGLVRTWFTFEGAYLNDGYINPNYPNVYSQTLLGKQVWYERTPLNRKEDGIGPKYSGRVPLQVLIDLLNSQVNCALQTSDGTFIENQDVRRAYKNWRLRYDTGTFYKTKSKDLYCIIDKDSVVYEVRGNPPAYRTDSKLGSPTYGERVETSAAEKSRWKNKSRI